MAFTNRQDKSKVWILLGVVLVVVIIIVIFIGGIQNLLTIVLWVIGILLVLGLLFLVAYIFWYLFIRKQKYDITYVNKMKLVDACSKSVPPGIFKRALLLSGDKGHSRVYFGKIVGYARIQILTRSIDYDVDGKPRTRMNPKTGELEPIFNVGQEEQDVFAVKQRTGLFGFFEEPSVIRVSPTDHDELIGDVVLYGFSLIPVSEYLFLNTDLLDVRKIDYAILKEAERGIMFESLRDMKEIVDKATGLDAPHIKGLEQKNLYDIPTQQNLGEK